ncbi:LLM class flavin-dependent oxidoreductase [Zhihengliuella sp.]|uniref:LLM class flavin-dependent oxidoreductase n=1 Tax=Zhihengliuella sp. TaxID=1954483 RepID=UPI002811D70E|nr:LLM class flavin-dependent oxidoreductase [Zhihengliuella sp.]
MPSPRPRLLLSAFLMNTPNHILGGHWRRPEAQQHRFNELSLWTGLARQLEDAKFDALFFADVAGLYGQYDGGWHRHVEKGLQVPANDPLVLASALAGATEDIGLALTSSIIQAEPFQFARQLSTLDHLTGGRVAWNIVTSVLENAHRNFGAGELEKHDERYAWAEEYAEAVYALWEGSWDDDAVLADKAAGRYADPAKVRRINHRGERYSIDGPHLVEPSPQRTPFLFQAGSSPRGRAFAGRHAEATFIFAPSPESAARNSALVREQAVAAGRVADDVKVFAGLSFVIGGTEEEARRKQESLEESLDLEYILAHIGGGLGVDLGGHDLDARLDDLGAGSVQTEGTQGHLETLRRLAPDGNPSLREIARARAFGQQIAGTPEQIADRLEQWQDAGIDGVNVMNQVLPDSYTDFIEGLLPELRRRGLAQTEYAPGTLREKVFGRGARVEASHPAAAFRGRGTDLNSAAAPADPTAAAVPEGANA